jgi:hypothetical protein
MVKFIGVCVNQSWRTWVLPIPRSGDIQLQCTHLKTILHKQHVGRKVLNSVLLNSVATEHECDIWWQWQVMPQLLQTHILTAVWTDSIHLISLLRPHQETAQLWTYVDISATDMLFGSESPDPSAITRSSGRASTCTVRLITIMDNYTFYPYILKCQCL